MLTSFGLFIKCKHFGGPLAFSIKVHIYSVLGIILPKKIVCVANRA